MTLTSCTERIARSELPLSRQELRKAANEERHANDDVGRRDTPRLDVEHRQDESSARETE